MQGAFSDYSGWKHTPIEYTLNTFASNAPGKSGVLDQQFTNAVMTRCADLPRTVGRSCSLSNHGLDQNSGTSQGVLVYGQIAALYAKHPGQTPVGFQTFSPDNFGGCQALNVAVAYHAQSLELWPPSANVHGFKGFSAYPEAELAQWARALRTRTTLAC